MSVYSANRSRPWALGQCSSRSGRDVLVILLSMWAGRCIHIAKPVAAAFHRFITVIRLAILRYHINWTIFKQFFGRTFLISSLIELFRTWLLFLRRKLLLFFYSCKLSGTGRYFSVVGQLAFPHWVEIGSRVLWWSWITTLKAGAIRSCNLFLLSLDKATVFISYSGRILIVFTVDVLASRFLIWFGDEFLFILA